MPNSFYQKASIANASSHSGKRSGLTALADKGVSVLMANAGHSQLAKLSGILICGPVLLRLRWSWFKFFSANGMGTV